MYSEQMELPTPFSQEELDALWFFGLGFYYEHTFWVCPGLLVTRLETRLNYPLSGRQILAAIEEKMRELPGALAGKPPTFAAQEQQRAMEHVRNLHWLIDPNTRRRPSS